MKSEWQFYFKTTDFIFEKDYKFDGNLSSNESPIIDIDFNLKININRDFQTYKDVLQRGKLFILVPLDYNKAKDYVLEILFQIVQRIKFEFGNIVIEGGLIMGTHIPETEEESKELGDKTHFAELCIEEVSKGSNFDAKKINKTDIDIHLVSQYNHAKEAIHTIDKFNGYFKILETIYKTSNRKVLKDSLKVSELFNIYKDIFITYEDVTKKIFENFIDEIVNTRHKCSHLKLKSNFGYLPFDKEIETKVKPLVEKMKYFTKKIIEIV